MLRYHALGKRCTYVFEKSGKDSWYLLSECLKVGQTCGCFEGTFIGTLWEAAINALANPHALCSVNAQNAFRNVSFLSTARYLCTVISAFTTSHALKFACISWNFCTVNTLIVCLFLHSSSIQDGLFKRGFIWHCVINRSALNSSFHCRLFRRAMRVSQASKERKETG